MKKTLAGICLMACAAYAQETNLPCFVVTDSSGTVPAGTVLYPKTAHRQRYPSCIFTNNLCRLVHGASMCGPEIRLSVTPNGITTNHITRRLYIYSFFDGTRTYEPRHYTNEVYLCTNEFVRLVRTNIVIRPQTK